MVPVAQHAVEVDFDEPRARLRVNGLRVFDDHDIGNSLTMGLGLPGDMNFPYPHIDPVAPVHATVSFDVEWNGIVATPAQIHNTAQTFKGSFFSTGATIRWSVEQPGFRFETETPPNPGRNLVSVLGSEQNGVFFA